MLKLTAAELRIGDVLVMFPGAFSFAVVTEMIEDEFVVVTRPYVALGAPVAETINLPLCSDRTHNVISRKLLVMEALVRKDRRQLCDILETMMHPAFNQNLSLPAMRIIIASRVEQGRLAPKETGAGLTVDV